MSSVNNDYGIYEDMALAGYIAELPQRSAALGDFDGDRPRTDLSFLLDNFLVLAPIPHWFCPPMANIMPYGYDEYGISADEY